MVAQGRRPVTSDGFDRDERNSREVSAIQGAGTVRRGAGSQALQGVSLSTAAWFAEPNCLIPYGADSACSVRLSLPRDRAERAIRECVQVDLLNPSRMAALEDVLNALVNQKSCGRIGHWPRTRAPRPY